MLSLEEGDAFVEATQVAGEDVFLLSVFELRGVDGQCFGGEDTEHVGWGDVAHLEATQLDAEDVVTAAAEGDDLAAVEGVNGGLLAGEAHWWE